MEPINKGEYITLENGKEFYVIDIVYDNDQKYVYLANDKDNLELLLGKEIKDEMGNVIIETLEDPEEIKRIGLKIINKNTA